MFIDSHCHFDFAPFSQDSDHYIQQAKAVGVRHLVVPSIGASNWAAIQQLSQQHPHREHSVELDLHEAGERSAGDPDSAVRVDHVPQRSDPRRRAGHGDDDRHRVAATTVDAARALGRLDDAPRAAQRARRPDAACCEAHLGAVQRRSVRRERLVH